MTATTVIVVCIVVIVVAVLAAVATVRKYRRPDGVATFQRQIDALSPEARQRVVDEVQRLDEEKKGPPDGP